MLKFILMDQLEYVDIIYEFTIPRTDWWIYIVDVLVDIRVSAN